MRAILLTPLLLITCAVATGARGETIWCSGRSLLPAWGFYPNGEKYGGTSSLDGYAAWTPADGEHVITWSADLAAPGEYHVWVRRYAGYGRVEVRIDDRPVAGGAEATSVARYVWQRNGSVRIASAGVHAVDVVVEHDMFDAILLTTDPKFNPHAGPLPPAVAEPKVDAPRAYRDDTALTNDVGFVVGAVRPYAMHYYDWIPHPQERLDIVRAWGAAEQYVATTFAVRDLIGSDEFRVEASDLAGPAGAKIVAGEIDLRVVHVRPRRIFFGDSVSNRAIPDLLLRDDRGGAMLPPKGAQGGFGGGAACVSAIPAHASRQFWITVHIPPGSPIGEYHGELRLTAGATRQRRLSFSLEVLDVDLKPVDGHYVIFHPWQPLDPKSSSFGDHNYIDPKRYAAELADMKRHGFNAVTMYGGMGQLPYVKTAGLTHPPCLMQTPQADAPQLLASAKAAGFDNLLFYGIDEPREPERIDLCRRIAEDARRRGISMMTAINDRNAFATLAPLLDYPICSIWGFAEPDSPVIAKLRAAGEHPISYFTVGPTFPLQTRIMIGTYNRACGFVGSAQWAYQDYPGAKQYEVPDAHGVAFPDESGNPIPNLNWEAARDGIDDMRYEQALDRAIASANGTGGAALDAAKGVRARHDAQLRCSLIKELCGTGPGDLDTTRRESADATVALRAILKK